MPEMKTNARLLGYLGLIPMLLCLLSALQGGALQWTALAVAYGYAAFIFSFLGGLWWGIGIARDDSPSWLFMAAVAPSLIALVSFLPWVWGAAWPQPSLFILGLCLMLSPLVDRAIIRQLAPPALPLGWMRLRLHLSLCLGAMALALGFI